MSGEGATWHENQLVPILRNGSIQDVYWTYSYGPIDDMDAEHGVGGVLVICTETTQQILSERRALLERQRFSELFEQSPSFIAVLRGHQHVFEMVNPRYAQLIDHRSVLGKRFADALPEAAEQGYVDLLDQVYRSGVPFSTFDARFELRSKNGGLVQELFLDFVYQPMRDAYGVITGVFIGGVDVTERHRAEARLRNAENRLRLAMESLQDFDRRKDRFLATLAHELRNPLAPISAASSMLARPDLPLEHVADCAGVIQRQSHAMALLLDDLLDVSRITSGKLELRPMQVSVESLVEAAVEAARPMIDDKHHALHIRLPESPQWLHADPLRIAQVLTNLLTNAAKYTDAFGIIHLDVHRQGETVEFQVTDNGVGFVADEGERLFEMFHQSESAKNRAQGGLGIGLALTRHLVELHDGRIEAHSDGAGCGASFTVALPASDSAPISVDATPSTIASANVPPALVLVADDNVDAAITMGMLLEIAGYRVVVAHDGLRARDAAVATSPAAALLDIGMPGLSGYELAAALRNLAECKDMLLIAMTGWGQHEDKQQALAAGFDEHLTKPVSPETILQLLAERLPRRGGAIGSSAQ